MKKKILKKSEVFLLPILKNQISKYLVEKYSNERTGKTAFLHKVLSRFQRLSVGTVY
jgi:hypothetical protein